MIMEERGGMLTKNISSGALQNMSSPNKIYYNGKGKVSDEAEK